MKIAVVTENKRVVSGHFGRAPLYMVHTVENGTITGVEVRDKPFHQHGHGSELVQVEEHGSHEHSHNHDHSSMISPIADCDVLIARGMGTPAYQSLLAAGIIPLITDVHTIDEAVRDYIDGTMVNHIEKLH